MSAPGAIADHLQSGGATEAVREAGPGPILGDISEHPTLPLPVRLYPLTGPGVRAHDCRGVEGREPLASKQKAA